MSSRPSFPSFLGSEAGMKMISTCPMCESATQHMQARVLEGNDSEHLVYLTCQKCAHAILALVQVGTGGMSSIGLLTDLREEEVMKFREGDAVSADDVLLAHAILEKTKHAFLDALISDENVPA